MLGLGKQIHSDPIRVGLTVAHHQNLGWAGDHIDAYLSKYRTLGGSHIDVARADDLIDTRHAFRAVRQRSNCLSATDRKDAVNSGQTRRCQYQLVDLTTRRGHHHDDFRYPSNLSGNRIHQN